MNLGEVSVCAWHFVCVCFENAKMEEAKRERQNNMLVVRKESASRN